MKNKFKFLATMLIGVLLSVNQAWGETYTISFVKGTTNGTDISDQLPAQASTMCASGSGYIASFSGEAAYYKANGCGIRIAKSRGAGTFSITLSDDVKSNVKEVIIYASAVASGNTLDVTPAGTVTAKTTFNSLSTYSTSAAISTYAQSAISINGTLTSLIFGATAKKYVHLHQIDIIIENSPSYTITPLSNNDSWGTVELKGSTITATPKPGYRVMSGDDGYSVTDGTATVTNNGDNTFTVTPSANCTVQINFESKGCTDHSGDNVTSGASTSYEYGPVATYYNYSTRQILYTKTDLELAAGKKGTIKSIYFEYASDDAITKKNSVKIYMANTNLTALSTSAYVPYSDFTEVYSGALNCSKGWNEISLATPFVYNGSGSLVVLIYDNSGAYESSRKFKCHEANTTTGAQIYKNNDYNNEDPSLTDWSIYDATNYRPNTKFCLEEADMTKATVNWYVNGSLKHTQNDYSGTTCTAPTTPTTSDCDGSKVFVGWTATQDYEHATTAPPDLFTDPATKTIPEGGKNYYAVFANASSGATTNYAKITSMAELTDNNYVFAYDYNGGTQIAMKNTSVNNDGKIDAEALSLSDYKYKNPGAAYIWRIQNVSSNNYTLYNAAIGKYISDTYDGLVFSDTPYNFAVTWDGTHNCFRFVSSNYTSYYLCGYVDSYDSYFQSSDRGGGEKYHVHLYKNEDGTTYSNYTTSCCTPLAAPTNLSAGTPGATSATITWSAVANATGYEYKLGDGDWTSAGNLSQAITSLTPCNNYSVHVRAIYSGDGNYCAEGPEASVNFSTSGYTYTFIENHVSTTDEKPSTTCDGNVQLEYVAESNYTLPTTITVEGATNYTWENGVLAIAAANVTGNVTVTITAVANACPSYSFSYGEKGSSYTTLCFEQVGETNEWKIENFVFPDVNTNQVGYVGYQGIWYGGNLGSRNSKSEDLYFENFPLALMQGVDGCSNTYKVGWSNSSSNGHNAIGALRIYTDYTDNNLYVGFIPNGYGMQYGTESQDDWQNLAFTDQGNNAWMTDLVTLTSDMVGNGNFKYWVGLLKSGGGYTYSSSISSTNTFNTMGSYCSNWGDTHWGANLSGYSAGDKGKFRIWVNSCNGHDTKNFVCHFVPFYQATFDAAGGTCDPVLPTEPISAEESAVNRTITLPTPTKTGYDFAGWNDGVSTVAAGTKVELTSNKSYTAQWTIKTTAITLDKNGGTTDGSAAATYGTGLSNYVAATRAETSTYKYELTGYYTKKTGGGDIKVIDEEGHLVANTTYTDGSGNWIGEVSELTLYARWDNYCKVTWVNNGGTVATTYIKQNETVGENMQADLASSAACSSTYNNFVGWYTEASGTETSPAAAAPATKVTASTVVDKKATYYAVWSNASGEGGATDDVSVDFTTFASYPTGFPTATGTSSGTYTFSGYSFDISAPTEFYRNGTDGSCYLFLKGMSGEDVSTISLPARSGYKLTKVTLTIPSSASTAVGAKIDGVTGGDQWTFVAGNSHDFELSGTAENTSYTLTFVNVSSGTKNAQVGALALQYTATTVARYISSCCSSDVNIAITSEPASPLALGLDGHATSTVSFAKTATNTIWMYEPTISPAGATFSDWSGTYKTTDYSLTFDATAAGTYTISEEAEDKGLYCSKVFNAEIVVEANPIIAAMKDEAAISALTVNGVCAGEGDANSFVIKSRYLTNAQVTVTASTTTGSGTYKVSKDGTNYSNSVNFTGGQDALGEQTIYVRYETSSESETGTLAGNIAITSEGATTQNVTLSGTCTCSPRVTATMSNNNIVAVNGSWSAGLSEVALSAYNLTMGVEGGVTIKFESTNNNFKLKANTTSGAGQPADNLSFAVPVGDDAWNKNIVVTYNPTTAGATETATITVKVIRTNGTKEYASTQFTVRGYSLPAEFVMATKVDGNWYTMTEVAAASGNTPSPGTQLVVDDATNPTIITGVADGYLPSITVFTPAVRLTPNTNAECVRFESKKKPGNFLRVPDDNTYLYFNSENSEGNSYWRMMPNPSVEGEFYIALPNNAHGRSLSAKDGESGKTTFGHFKTTTSWRLLPLSNEVELCTRYIAPNVQVTKLTNGSNDVTLKVSSTNGEPETLGYEYSTDQTSWTAMTGTGTSATVTLTGLTKGTEYTYYVRGIVTDETENCSGEKEVTFSPFNPIVTVTPSSLDLTCLAGETDTKDVTIDANADAAGWTATITGTNASMFSFNAGTSEVTFSPAVGTADGDYTATLTIKSQAGNASANVALTGTVISKAAMVFGIEDLNGGMICEKQIRYPETGIYVYLNNGSAVYSAGDRTTKANAPAQISDAVFIRDLSTGGADVQTEFSYGVNAGVAHFIIKQANLVYGHTYRISYYNDLANGGNGLFNAEGLGFADGYVDFVYSADCSKPTAILPCITSPTTAVANWEYAACDGDATVEVYTKTSNVVHEKSLKETCNNWGFANRNKNAWGLLGNNNSSDNPASSYGWTLYRGGYTYVYSPEMSEISSSITSSTVVTVTVAMKNTKNYACTMNVYPVICATNPSAKNPTFTQKTAYFDQSTTKDIGSYSVPANANGETIEFTISGLESNYSLCFASRAEQIALFVQNVKFEIKGKNSFKTLTPSCSAEEVEITGLSANTKYYYTVTNGGKTSNEIGFTTWADGAGSVKFYNNEERTSSYEITSSDNILVLGGEQTTVYLSGTKVAGCEPVVSVSAGYRIEDHSTYNPSTGALGGYVVLTLADPTQTEGTLTVTDGAGGTTVRNIISSTCPAGMSTMALPATNIEANSATANWNNGLTFDADDKSGKLYIFRDGSVDRELIENGGFETGNLTGWNYVNAGGIYACKTYEVVNSNGHSGSHSLHVTEEGSGEAGFAFSTVIYQNPMTLYPGTYVMTSWVKMTSADCGSSDKNASFVQGLVGHQNQGSTNETCFAISSASTNRTRNNTYTTVTSNGTYVQLVDTFVLSKTIKALPIVGERCDYGYDFRPFYLDDVMMKRISAPISEDYDKLIEIADLSATNSVAMTGLSGNTQYSYMIQDANGCSSNVITFKTLQSGEPSIEAEGIELSASQDKTATGVIVVTALDAYAPITITKCLDSKISLNTNTLPAEGGAIRVTFAPGATAAGTSGTCELSLITTGMRNSVTVNVLWTVTAGEDVNTPKVDVTEVWTDSLTIEHNVGLDAVDSISVQFSREKTAEEVVLNVGDEIFFSKYYEAYSHKKLWAIFNPRNDTISLAGMEVWRSKSDGTWNTDEVIDLSDAGFYEQGWIYPQEEIVVYTADQVGGCEQRHVDMSTWYAGAHADLALSFSGDDALLLVRNTAEESEEKHNELRTTSAKGGDISWPDAIYERGEEWHMLDIIGAHDGSYNPTSEACTNWDWYNSKTKVNESGDDKGWVGYGYDMNKDENRDDYNDGQGHIGYLLSTNRCLLVRRKKVTSGANALATNINDMFTLNDEWRGSHVPTSTPGMTQDSVSCVNFSYVGGYNYAGYYNSWTEMDDYEIAAKPNPDGSWTVVVDVPAYSCKMFHIEAVKMDTINGVVSPNVVTSTDYKVPIVVDKNKATTADLFNFGGDTCATCDVVVRDAATLSHVTGGKSQFRELIVYPGAKFDNSSKQGFLLDRITVQSKNNEVGYAIINDNGSSIDAGEVRHVKRVDDQHWYSFSLPYDCKISSIQQQNGKSMGEYSEDWVIAYYDGARRQADKADEHIGESSQYWIDMPSDGVLEANKAYIIGLYTTEWPGQVKNVYFPPYVAGGHKAYSESGDDAKTANIYNWTAGVADNPARNHGWNFVGSPYISKFNETTDGQGLNNGSLIMKGKMNEAGEITEDLEHVYISIPADADMMTYNQVLASSQKILPFTGYFVQAKDPTSGSNETLELVYAKDNRTLETPERRATATRQRVLVELNVIAPNGDKDNTGIWVDDRYTVNYEIGRDLMKIYGEAGRPQLYSRAADNIAMAYIALPDDNAEYIPLELYAPKAGKYTLKIDDNTSMTAGAQTIELLYNNATVADLFFEAYDIEAPKAGTIKGYAVRIRRWAQVITSDEQIGGQNITIIANDGQMSVTNLPANATVSLYDVLGHLMATGYAADGVVNFNAPATGVYNIVVESAVGHTTIKTVIK